MDECQVCGQGTWQPCIALRNGVPVEPVEYLRYGHLQRLQSMHYRRIVSHKDREQLGDWVREFGDIFEEVSDAEA